ncbi:hypothetical protein AAC387_Pa04g1155 [Persea americana]
MGKESVRLREHSYCSGEICGVIKTGETTLSSAPFLTGHRFEKGGSAVVLRVATAAAEGACRRRYSLARCQRRRLLPLPEPRVAYAVAEEEKAEVLLPEREGEELCSIAEQNA